MEDIPYVVGLDQWIGKEMNDSTKAYLKDFGVATASNGAVGLLLFTNHIDSLAAAGVILADVWVDGVSMPVVDSLGDEFLNYVKDGMKITIKENGIVEVE